MLPVKFRVIFYGFALLTTLLSGVVSAQKPLPQVGPPAPAEKSAATAESTAPKTAPESSTTGTVGQPVDPNKYLIGPEDILFINVWREHDLTMPASVRPDGKITMPLIGDVQAGGLTPAQLTKEIADKLGTYINRPDVNVMVTAVRSKKYYIDGEVNRPGEFYLIGPTRVLEALSNAGGFKEFANTKKIKILRAGKVYNFNYKEVTSGKKLEQNIVLRDGDHIIVK